VKEKKKKRRSNIEETEMKAKRQPGSMAQ